MLESEDLLERLKDPRTKEAAYKELLDLYHERLYWHIRKLVIIHEDANDVLQNTFIRVYKSLPKFRAQSTLHTWIYRIAYNESLRLIEKNKKKLYNSIEDVNTKYISNLEANSHFDGTALQIKLKRVISKLPERERIIFQMKYYDDLKFKEIAEILEIKESTLKSSYYNTVKSISDKVVEEELCEDLNQI